jgi:hypothetical protein
MDKILPCDPEPLGVGSEIQLALNGISDRLSRWVDANHERLEELARMAHRHLLFDSAGWLPHYTTPFYLVKDDTNATELSALLDDYYRQNWTHIRQEFNARLSGLAVDEEAKATFSEALDGHGHGLFRATPRLLFPEIERIARVELLGGKLSGMTSLVEVREAAGSWASV